MSAEFHEVVDELRVEVNRLQKSSTMMAIGGVVISIFMLGYMQWIYGSIRDLTEPEALAETAVAYSEEQLVSGISAVGEAAENGAPEVVGQLYDALDDQLEGFFNTVGEDFELAMDDYATGLEDWLIEYFDHQIKDNPQIGLLKDGDSEKANEIFAGLEKEITTDVAQKLETGMGQEVDDAAKLLRDLRKRLEKLSKGKGLSADEKEEKELILAFFRVLDVDPDALGQMQKEIKDL